ncbi:uncharacterized protein LOC123269763 [Cotesia glomerata]|uniref:Uncharacterized protein n=1 Tax=Cotesia glomerata TaxID=32391 RepID=A0AAV7IRV1_COTGL|nr:uncharacterized protein LOC123269763 [Cotesia glomerata]KAH0567498.1 hypothetical protein KQX54_010450 [Cotesia glomerata]
MPGKRRTKKPLSIRLRCKQMRLARKKKLEFLKLADSIFENKNESSSTPAQSKSSKSNLEVPSCEVDENEEEIVYEEIEGYFPEERLEETSNIDNSEDFIKLNKSNDLNNCTEEEPEERLIIKVDPAEYLLELNQSNGLDNCTEENLNIKIEPTEDLSELNQLNNLVYCTEEKEQSFDNNSSKIHALNLPKLNKFTSNYEVKYKAVVILSHDLDYYSEEEEEIPAFNSDEIDKKFKT